MITRRRRRRRRRRREKKKKKNDAEYARKEKEEENAINANGRETEHAENDESRGDIAEEVEGVDNDVDNFEVKEIGEEKEFNENEVLKEETAVNNASSSFADSVLATKDKIVVALKPLEPYLGKFLNILSVALKRSHKQSVEVKGRSKINENSRKVRRKTSRVPRTIRR